MRGAVTSVLVLAASCGPNVPPDADCAAVLTVESDAQLQTALASAGPGECILLADGSYAGPILLPAGVRLVGESGASPQISGGTPAVIRAGDGGAIHGITVSSGPAEGILIEAIDFTIARTAVFDVVGSAVGIRCEDPGCLRGQIALDDLELRRARAGVVVSGANAIMRGGVISGAAATGLSGGGATYVANGGALAIEGTEIADSDYGAVADGAGTRLELSGAIVRDCSSAGVWAQGLRGSAGAPALAIDGSTAIFGHAGIGVLILDSAGAAISDATIEGTTLRSTVLPGGMNAELGDGLLVLASSSDVSVQSTALRDNARAQAIVDAPGAGITFAANTVDATGGEWEVVVQNGGIPVTVPAEDLSTAPALPVPSDRLVVPAFGP